MLSKPRYSSLSFACVTQFRGLMPHRVLLPAALAAILLLLPFRAGAQLRAVETDIPVRDGQTLKADVYVNAGSRPKPVILVQTPYNRLLYRLNFALYRQTVFPLDSSRYHYVIVDWRGFYGSKDAAVQGYDRGLDGYDIVEWIAAQPWCNGKVATYGGSALGMIQFQTARQHPPHLVCAVPMIKDYLTKYSDYYYGGALRREHTEALQDLGFTTVSLITSQPVENNIWRTITQQSDMAGDIAVPMLLVSGWFDHYPDDVIRAFEDLRARSAEDVRLQHRLIMGPWTHSGVDLEEQGELSFPNAVNVARDAAFAFLDYHLNGAKNGWPLTPVVRYYQMGENAWKDCDEWSSLATATRRFHLADDNRLTDGIDGGPREADGFTTDPRDPSPSHGASRFNPLDPSIIPGPLDIRQMVESRGDVLLFTTDPFAEDFPVNGGGTLRLYVRCDRPDADFTVRFCDVYPDGRSIILTDAVHRARFREGTDREVLMQPNTVYTVDIRLQDIAHTFLAGHRLRLVVGGADYPRFDINLHDGGAMYTDGDTLIAHSEVLHSAAYASALTLETMSRSTATQPLVPPAELRIDRAWPRPLREGQHMQIRCSTEQGGRTRLEIRDLLGRSHRVLHDGEVPASATLSWDGTDASGSALPAGTYLLVLSGNGMQHVLPVQLLR